MSYYLKNLEWITKALANPPDKLNKLIPVDSCIPAELMDHYEMIIDKDLNNFKEELSKSQIDELKKLNDYVYSLFCSEKLADKWNDDNFIYSEQWQNIQVLAKNFATYMKWENLENLEPLYSQIVDVNHE
jgi:hypothetical protein